MANSNANTTEKLKVGKADIVKQATSSGQSSQSDQIVDNVQEMLSTSVTTAKSALMTLPPELRLIIYTKVVENMPDTVDFDYHRVLQSNLSQPQLARVNKQLRNEVLPIFYKSKRFVIRVQPEDYSETSSLWWTVVDGFLTLQAVVDGESHLSRIERLDIELWDKSLKKYPRLGFIPADIKDLENFEFYNRVIGGIYLQFGPATAPGPNRSQGRAMLRNDDNDFLNRDGVRASLRAGITSERRVHNRRRLQTSFWPSFPLERLVDLAIMVGTKCEVPARDVRLGTGFVDLGWVGNDASFGPFVWSRPSTTASSGSR